MRGITIKHEKRAVVQITIRTATQRAPTPTTLSCAHSPDPRVALGGGGGAGSATRDITGSFHFAFFSAAASCSSVFSSL